VLADLVLQAKGLPDPEQQVMLFSLCARAELAGATEALELLASEFDHVSSLEEARHLVVGLLEEIRYLASREFLAEGSISILRVLLELARGKARVDGG